MTEWKSAVRDLINASSTLADWIEHEVCADPESPGLSETRAAIAKVQSALECLEREAGGSLLEITAMFEVECGNLIGSTSAPIKRIETEDDGSITIVIDHWPNNPTYPTVCFSAGE